MTADMLPRQDAEIPFEGMMTDEEKARLQAEARTLLLATHELNLELKTTRSLKKRKELEAKALDYLLRADELIAVSLGITIEDDPHYRHDPKLVGVRQDLRKEALEHRDAPSRAAFEIGRRAFTDVKRAQREQDTTLDYQSLAAGEGVKRPDEVE